MAAKRVLNPIQDTFIYWNPVLGRPCANWCGKGRWEETPSPYPQGVGNLNTKPNRYIHDGKTKQAMEAKKHKESSVGIQELG